MQQIPNALTGLEKEQVIKVLEKAQKIQKRKSIKKNTISEDFSKGHARNFPCPVCNKKMKKCICEMKKL